MSDEKKNNETTLTSTYTDTSSIQIQQLFKFMVNNKASDLHLVVGAAPAMRIHGDVTKVKMGRLKPEDTKRMIYQVLTSAQKKELEENMELDFSFGVKGLARFRANVFYSKGALSGVFRQIPSVIPDFDQLALPGVLLEMTNATNGLILVTGPTGSGKSTTLASIIDRLNQQEYGHIVTLEDPIEFVHNHKNSIINQREIGADTLSFHKGLKSLLRQDPDIVLVGELRDIETIEAALTVAETGHLVFATLHTNSCIQTINRIVNVFPGDQQDRIRTLLSFVLQGVVSQQLIPNQNGGRALVQEILIPTAGIKNLVRENKIHQIYSQMQVGQDKTGMITMNQSLARQVEKGNITPADAMAYTTRPDELAKSLGIKI